MSEPLIFEVEVDDMSVAVEVQPDTVEVIVTDEPRVIVLAVPGQQGVPGPPGQGVQVFGEPPGGTRNGSNLTFVTGQDFRPNSTAVYLNGLREDGYTESLPHTIVFDDPPSSADRIFIDYIVAG